MSELLAYIYETNRIILGKYLFSVEVIAFLFAQFKEKGYLCIS